MALEMLGLFGVVESILVLVFAGCMGVVGTIPWIWMIIDCATKEPSTGNNKIVWILVIIFTHWIWALIYLLVRRPQRIAELGS